MSLGILGKKVGMTRVFDNEAGCMIPVTVIDVNGNELLQVKTTEKDGYSAIQVGYDDQKERRLNLPERTHQAKHGASSAKKLVKEFRFESDDQLPNKEEGHPGAALFEDGQIVAQVAEAARVHDKGDILLRQPSQRDLTRGLAARLANGSALVEDGTWDER